MDTVWRSNPVIFPQTSSCQPLQGYGHTNTSARFSVWPQAPGSCQISGWAQKPDNSNPQIRAEPGKRLDEAPPHSLTCEEQEVTQGKCPEQALPAHQPSLRVTSPNQDSRSVTDLIRGWSQPPAPLMALPGALPLQPSIWEVVSWETLLACPKRPHSRHALA